MILFGKIAVTESIKSADAPAEKVALEIEVCGDCQSTVPELCFEAKGNRDFIRWDGKSK